MRPNTPSKSAQTAALSAALAAALAATGCKPSSTTGGGPANPAGLRSAFSAARGPGQGMAAEAASALEAGETTKAFNTLAVLSSQPDLTPEQRAETVRAMAAAGKKLAEAAKNGDADAAKALETYRSGK